MQTENMETLMKKWNISKIRPPTKRNAMIVFASIFADEKNWIKRFVEIKEHRFVLNVLIDDAGNFVYFFMDDGRRIIKEYKLHKAKQNSFRLLERLNRPKNCSSKYIEELEDDNEEESCSNRYHLNDKYLSGFRVCTRDILPSGDWYLFFCRNILINTCRVQSRDICDIILGYVGKCGFKNYCKRELDNNNFTSIDSLVLRKIFKDHLFPWGTHFVDMMSYLINTHEYERDCSIIKLYELWFQRYPTSYDRYGEEIEMECKSKQWKLRMYNDMGIPTMFLSPLSRFYIDLQ